jgi:hypothetical protein
MVVGERSVEGVTKYTFNQSSFILAQAKKATDKLPHVAFLMGFFLVALFFLD